MMETLAAADSHWSWLIFGRMHPMVVHFPIALLLVATLVEGLGILRRRAAAGDASWLCVGLAALGAIASTLMGYAFADQKRATPALELHERWGLVTTVVAFLAAVLAWRARRMGGTGGPAVAYRTFLFLGALGVSVTGHLGGELVYGDIFDGVFPPKSPISTSISQKSSTLVSDGVDFEKQIAPIIKASCLKCHGAPPNKVKGKLRLDNKAAAFKGGSGGKSIVPGDLKGSTFYTLLVADNPDDRMPAEAPPLPLEQIELIKKWIQQGAHWPESFEIK